MNISSRWLRYAVVGAVFLAAKLLYAQATTTDVRFLLGPTNAVVGVMLNSASEFDAARGYSHAGLGILIDKSCAGGNFWLLSWLLFALTYLRQQGRWPLVALPLLSVISLALTVLVNAARIAGAVHLTQLLPAGTQQPAWLHEAQGALVYLGFLVAFHMGLSYCLSYFSLSRAHSAQS